MYTDIVRRVASVTVLGAGFLFATPVLADITVEDIPISFPPVDAHLVEAGSIETGDVDDSVVSWTRWIAGREERREAKRQAELLAELARRRQSSPTVRGTGACGGDLPSCAIMECESGGALNVWNGQGSSASGKWQITEGTWGGYGGYPNAASAPEEVQDEKARELKRDRGTQPWESCGG